MILKSLSRQQIMDRPTEEIDRENRDISVSTTNTFLCSKRGFMDIKDHQLEPCDADNSHFEEMFLQDRILRILTCNRSAQEVTCLFKNENYLEDPSAISYFEEDSDLGDRPNTYVLSHGRGVIEDNVAVLYFPRERRAHIVVLERKSNIFQRCWTWTKKKWKSVRSRGNSSS